MPRIPVPKEAFSKCVNVSPSLKKERLAKSRLEKSLIINYFRKLHLRCGMFIVAHLKWIEVIVSQRLLGICLAWLYLVSVKKRFKFRAKILFLCILFSFLLTLAQHLGVLNLSLSSVLSLSDLHLLPTVSQLNN